MVRTHTAKSHWLTIHLSKEWFGGRMWPFQSETGESLGTCTERGIVRETRKQKGRH